MHELLIVSLPALLLLPTPAAAQELLHHFEGSRPGEYFGVALSGAGDVDADGCADLIVGAGTPYYTGDVGIVRVYSGRSGALLHELKVEGSNDFGAAVCGAGDLNLDGFDDFLVGDPFNGAYGALSGRAVVHSGRDGARLYEFFGELGGDKFGHSVAAAGDVDADGHPDLIVGAKAKTGVQPGYARVHSGRDGSVLLVLRGTGISDYFGKCVDGIGDLDRDGHADVLVSAPREGSGGVVRIYSGRTGLVLLSLTPSGAYESIGWMAAAAGDVNADGWPDVAATLDSSVDQTVKIYSGRDGSVLRSFSTPVRFSDFGRALDGAGDVNGDGYADLIVGWDDHDNGEYAGGTFVFSGMDGSILHEIEGDSAGAYFGWSVTGAGDLDADGFPDLAVGAIGGATPAGRVGTVTVIAGGPPPPFHLQAAPLDAGASAEFTVSAALPGQPVYLAFSTRGYGSAAVPRLGVTLQLDHPHPLGSGIADQDGAISWITPTIPSAFAGRTLWAQACQRGAVSNWVRRAVR